MQSSAAFFTKRGKITKWRRQGNESTTIWERSDGHRDPDQSGNRYSNPGSLSVEAIQVQGVRCMALEEVCVFRMLSNAVLLLLLLIRFHVVFQCTFGRLAAGKTITVKVVLCASTNSAHAQPDIGLSPATPNVPKSEVDTVLWNEIQAACIFY